MGLQPSLSPSPDNREPAPAMPPISPPSSHLAAVAEMALGEDLGPGARGPAADLTTAWTVPTHRRARATILSKAPGVVAGLAAAAAVFHRLDPDIAFEPGAEEGNQVGAQTEIARLEGPARPLLAGERSALNLLQHLSGVATLTRAFVEAVAGTGAQITDTRKTLPGLRLLEKHAVRLGGGVNHRMGLYDAVLIKENHAVAAGGVDAALRLARQAARENQKEGVAIFVEARNLSEVRRLLPLRPDRILLDNMSVELMRQAVPLIRQSPSGMEIEATGNITLDNAPQVAVTGVDLISIGALTHSAPALDLSMLFSTCTA